MKGVINYEVIVIDNLSDKCIQVLGWEIVVEY